MQVVCGNCQLTFDAPEGTTGLVCPICRSPLQADAGGGAGPAATATKMMDWSGGTLPDLIALLSAPAASARVEVIAPGSDKFIGEVHLVAGGVSDAIYEGNATDDALDRLLLITGARFRVDPRLPDPKTGDLGKPGAEAGTLDGRPLAHLMRYCEDYVITCGIEVWRGNETARVDYRRGEISGVTVGGIDAPERLAEVMQWASGNYRLNVPPISLPAVAPKHAPAPAPVAAPEPAARSATKTIFGLPQSEVAAARAAAEAIMAAQGVGTPAPPEVAPPPAVAPAPVAVPAPAPMPVVPITPPGLAPSAIPAPMAASRGGASRTIFGMAAPSLPEGFAPLAGPTPMTAAPAPVAEPAAAAQVAEVDTGRTDRIVNKTGARKVAVPAPEIVPPAETAAPAPAPTKEVGRTTQHGFETRPSAPQKKAEKAQDHQEKKTEKAQDKTAARADKAPARAASSPPSTQRPTAIWAYVGVGFTFGLVLLGIYQLVGRLAH